MRSGTVGSCAGEGPAFPVPPEVELVLQKPPFKALFSGEDGEGKPREARNGAFTALRTGGCPESGGGTRNKGQ